VDGGPGNFGGGGAAGEVATAKKQQQNPSGSNEQQQQQQQQQQQKKKTEWRSTKTKTEKKERSHSQDETQKCTLKKGAAIRSSTILHSINFVVSYAQLISSYPHTYFFVYNPRPPALPPSLPSSAFLTASLKSLANH